MTIDTCSAPIVRAKNVYGKEQGPRSFAEDLCLHLENPKAIVVSTPDLFLMARPVHTCWDYGDIVDPRSYAEYPDAWWIHCLAGDPRSAMLLEHQPLPYVGWERNNVPKFYELSHVENLFCIYGRLQGRRQCANCADSSPDSGEGTVGLTN